jgi:hypothetical protein
MPALLATADAGTLLATLTLPTPAFGAAASGVATSAAITAVDGVATGAMDYFRLYDGATCVGQGLVGQSFALTDWVNVSDTSATANLPSGHGLTTGSGFMVLWAGGARANVTATITSDAVVFSGGIGDAFPASATANVFAGQGDLLFDDTEVSDVRQVAIDAIDVALITQ